MIIGPYSNKGTCENTLCLNTAVTAWYWWPTQKKDMGKLQLCIAMGNLFDLNHILLSFNSPVLKVNPL